MPSLLRWFPQWMAHGQVTGHGNKIFPLIFFDTSGILIFWYFVSPPAGALYVMTVLSEKEIIYFICKCTALMYQQLKCNCFHMWECTHVHWTCYRHFTIFTLPYHLLFHSTQCHSHWESTKSLMQLAQLLNAVCQNITAPKDGHV